RGNFHLGTDRRACRPPIARCVGRSRVAHALVSNETPTQEILSSANYPTRQCRTPAFAVRLHTFANASPLGDNNRPQMFLVFFQQDWRRPSTTQWLRKRSPLCSCRLRCCWQPGGTLDRTV